MARKRRRYDDKFRATAVVMLEAQGYPDKKGGLTKVANHLGIPLSTLKGWYEAKRNPPPTELRNEKKGDLVALIDDELDAALAAMGDKRPEATYRDIGTVFGILIDKRQILTGGLTDKGEVLIRVLHDR